MQTASTSLAATLVLVLGLGLTTATGCAHSSPRATSHAADGPPAMTAPFQHVVHFWLRDDLSTEQHEAFLAGLASLGNSPNVADLRVAFPAQTPRDIVDNSYDVQLTVWFDSSEAHDAYQSPADEAHVAFGKTFKPFWTRVLIYDSIVSAPTE
ncbi:MAG: Dabb family protein [Planctomycetota bacterium]